ncbi:hypothetical protein N6L26_00590 [Qipengyuania sp. SS22]|uniref:hypothetical protein n=1 Tax=Qipengyuania sp. SS22 TaxID=2979461 RepID=UPI0021E60D94|nr:hypothetical protein [Qipengyuania sp. SS22]UYH55103.1 hypothetical protein N6L26_00590 [Qipengyuania sp. SS22]
MIGKVIGAFVGDRLAKQTGGIGGASGAALGVVATSVLRRMSLPAMVALGVGGYVVKKVIDKKQVGDDTSTPPQTSTAPASAAKARAA